MFPLFQDLATKKNIVFLTGAGVSTASGLRDFRGTGGLEDEGVNLVQDLSVQSLKQTPDKFWSLWHQYLQIPEGTEPNIVHKTIGEIGKFRNVTVITQNIDGLHDAYADTTEVIGIHGQGKVYCQRCGELTNDYPLHADCPMSKLGKKSRTRPQAVLYGERLNPALVNHAIQRIQAADVLIVVGTSLQVYPVANFLQTFTNGSLYYMNLNLPEDLPSVHVPMQVILGDVTDLFKQIYTVLTNQPSQ